MRLEFPSCRTRKLSALSERPQRRSSPGAPAADMSARSTYGTSGMLTCCVFLLRIAQSAVAGASWTYTGDHGQDHWAESYPDCDGMAQSPINIKTADVSYDGTLPPIRPEGYSSPGGAPFTLSNNGHTVKLSLPPSMQLSGLPNNYTAVQLHLHWGNTSNPEGSEHQLDGKMSLAELHIVHYNSDKFPNINEAKDKPNGLAVLGVLIETGSEDNAAYGKILSYLDKVTYADQSVSVPSFNIEVLLPEGPDQYFRYGGSLTTPPCYESVVWTIFYNKVQISMSQMDKLQTMLYSTKASSPSAVLQSNVRHPQPLNQRTVYSSFMMQPALTTGKILGIVFGTFLGLLGLSLVLYYIIKQVRKHREQTSGPSEQPGGVKA
ncbi:carbonic anhydrase 14 [Dendrobates tinctorius]|uniref:carbonic anhydrase 14 n=1 Tax=Dendrobates tinctorius TaxID=92724 RepID=UPI003CC986A1